MTAKGRRDIDGPLIDSAGGDFSTHRSRPPDYEDRPMIRRSDSIKMPSIGAGSLSDKMS